MKKHKNIVCISCCLILLFHVLVSFIKEVVANVETLKPYKSEFSCQGIKAKWFY